MYCQKCGKEIDESSTFCSACGSSQTSSNHNSQPNYGPGGYNTVVQEKNLGIAIILAVIIIGAGHLYIGKIKEGIVYFLAACIISFVLLGILWPFGGLVVLILWVWNIYDAYTNAKKFNDHLRQTGTPLW